MEQRKTIRPRNYLYEGLIIVEELIIVGIYWFVLGSWKYALVAGGITYLVLAWTLRLSLQRYHRKGMKLLHNKQNPDAVLAFQSSYDFFSRYPWIDKYCFITMFSSNAIPYRQMALNNMGICYLYMEQNQKALETFQKLAQLNPDFPNIAKTIDEISKHMKEVAVP